MSLKRQNLLCFPLFIYVFLFCGFVYLHGFYVFMLVFFLTFVLLGQQHNAEPFVEIIKILKIRTVK